jgi:hypothetical protein
MTLDAGGCGVDRDRVICPFGRRANTTNTAASASRLIQRFSPCSHQPPSGDGANLVLIERIRVPPPASVIAIPASSPARSRGSQRWRVTSLAWRAIIRPCPSPVESRRSRS